MEYFFQYLKNQYLRVQNLKPAKNEKNGLKVASDHCAFNDCQLVFGPKSRASSRMEYSF